jgi:hypothetical protein
MLRSMGTGFAKPAENLPQGWEWFELPAPATSGDWNWAARSSSDHTRQCRLTPDRNGVKTTDTSDDALFAAAVVWRAYLQRLGPPVEAEVPP